MSVKHADHKDADKTKTAEGEGTLPVSIIIISN